MLTKRMLVILILCLNVTDLSAQTSVKDTIPKNDSCLNETMLFPCPDHIEIYSGEEKTIEIPARNIQNIRLTGEQIKSDGFDYSLSKGENSLKVFIHPGPPGNKTLFLRLKTTAPFRDSTNRLSDVLPPYVLYFTVKPSRLDFINMDQGDFFLDYKSESNEDIQIDQKKGLEPGKTYRIEDQLEPGGKLIAELYVKSLTRENKALCSFRAYSHHNVNEGYLYVKQQNEARYITNFNVLPKPVVERISVLSPGGEWTTQPVIHPGEHVQVKIEGSGFSKAKFRFSDCTNVSQDSTRVFDDVVFYSFIVPLNISNTVVYVEMNKKRTKYELAIKENQHPRDFDYLFVNYGSSANQLTSALFNKPVLDPHPLNDINISFKPSMIDEKEELFGKQYLDMEFRIYNSKNDLIEEQKVENIQICPDESSPRGKFYDQKGCLRSAINVNDYLLHKTYELEGWSKVEIIVKNTADKYAEPGYSRRIIIIKQKRTSLDLQASFPAGLLLKDLDTKGTTELSGLSVAFLAQMSFYEKGGIARMKPYKVGAGFMALNLFNLESSASQPDVAAVVIGSLLPLKPASKFNFPLYLGFGYMLKSGQWFTLLGPGVQFNF
jgi:hypothetical protein